MSCAFPKELLALHLEGDLSGAREQMTSAHLATCDGCRRFLEQLRARQLLLKSLRHETIAASECTRMRRDVMRMIHSRIDKPSWLVRIERAIMGGCRRPAYAVAAFAFLGILSVSLAEQTHVPAETGSRVPVFEGADTLLRPEGYENWILVGEAMGTHPGVASRTGHDTRPSTHGVYINPSSYREYVKTGRFPDGTLMVWQSEGALLTSVKDTTRFDGGWGFFDFSRVDGTVAGKARPVSESSGCRTCHQREAQTDHVFTQFYPVLQTARRAVQFAGPADKGRSADASNAFIPTSLPRYGRTASV